MPGARPVFAGPFVCQGCKKPIHARSQHFEVTPGDIFCARCARGIAWHPCMVYLDAADLRRELRGRADEARSRAAEDRPDVWQAMIERATTTTTTTGQRT